MTDTSAWGIWIPTPDKIGEIKKLIANPIAQTQPIKGRQEDWNQPSFASILSMATWSLCALVDSVCTRTAISFANLTFCQANTQVLELKPKYAGLVIANLAKKIKLNYREISSEPTKYSNNNQQGLISIPINLLEKKIS